MISSRKIKIPIDQLEKRKLMYNNSALKDGSEGLEEMGSVKVQSHCIVNKKGQNCLIGYLRPEFAAIYCSVSESHFKKLLSDDEIPFTKWSDKITLVKISDIDEYCEKKRMENRK